MRSRERLDRLRPQGFTLIEVMAALVVVGLGMLGVIQAVNQTVNNTSYLRDKSIAHWVAMNRLTEARLVGGAPSIDTTSGTAQMAGREWRWTMTVNETTADSMLRIDVSVAPAEAQKDASLATVSGFYGKAVAPAASARVAWQGEATGQPAPSAKQNSGTGGNPAEANNAATPAVDGDAGNQ